MITQLKQSTQDALKRAVAFFIPVSWRSSAAIQSGGDRRSYHRTTSGFSFVGNREYRVGDRARDVDWPLTARTGAQKMIVKLFEEPRSVNVVAVVNIAPSMDFGSGEATKLELANELTATIMRSAQKSQDKCGVVAYQPGVVRLVKPSSSRGVLEETMAAISSGEPLDPDSTGSGLPDALMNLPRSRSLVFIISDEFSEADLEAIEFAAATHEVICLIIEDIRERELPPGWGFYQLLDLSTGKDRLIWLSAANRRKYADNFAANQNRIKTGLLKAGCAYAVFDSDELETASTELMRLLMGRG
jgi:uncharacterized protein (DUF58 family)